MNGEGTTEMNEPGREERTREIVQAYIDIGTDIRMTSLPNWMTVELNITQLKAIILLEHHGVLTVSELARLLGTGKPAASILVQQLVEQGFAERSEDMQDRRRTFVRPTPQGASLMARRREQIRLNLERWVSKMNEEDLAHLQQGLEALREVAKGEKRGEEGTGDS